MKNVTVTAAAEAKKRKGYGRVKAVSKRHKIGSTSAATSISTGEEIGENVGRGSVSAPLSTGGRAVGGFHRLGRG